MNTTPTPEQMARWLAVYAVLVEHAGAADQPHSATDFASTMLDGCEEYRFQGYLGFGGKFWPKRMQVDCYPEDMNHTRTAIIERTNAALKALDPA